MKILDKYIIKKFFFTFFPISIVSTFLVTIVDFTNKNNTFLSNNLSSVEIIDYYSSYILYIANFNIPFVVFITIIFINTRLSKNNEIIAILCSGRSFKRFIATFVSAACFLSIGIFFVSNWALPHAINKKIHYENKLGLLSFSQNSKYIHIQFDTNHYLYITTFDSLKNEGKTITIEKIINNELVEKYYSDTMFWESKNEKWVLQNWTKKEINAKGEKITTGNDLIYDLKLKPTDLELNPRLYETLTITKLHQKIKSLKKNSSNHLRLFLSELHERYMHPFASIILTVLGVIISSSRSRNRSGIKISIGIVLAFIYIAMYLFAKSYADAISSNISLTIWAPNIIFSIICFVLYKFRNV